jgi:penicillin-binding protein 1A
MPRVWRRRLVRGLIIFAVVLLLAIGAAVAYGLLVIAPNLPSIGAVTDYQPKIPLRIYTADHVLIGEFGEEHRDFIPIAKVPAQLKQAILAIEDKRFYEHHGIDWIRAFGAAKANLRGGFRQGFSTITMQVARNFFLTREKRISRKLNEIALASKIESALSKEQILEIYINQIYLGQRSYGFGSAATMYFGKPLDQLSLAQLTMLAGLPQNPARNNPVKNPRRARARQHLVLENMRAQGSITDAQYQQAMAETLHVNMKGQEYEIHAEYVAELARQAVYAQFAEESYSKGLIVTTTILKADQEAAYRSLRRNVLDYDQRHGYRGPEAVIELPEGDEQRSDAIGDALQKRSSSDGLLPVVVVQASTKLVTVETIDGERIDINGAGLKFVSAALASNAKPALKLVPGAVVRIERDAKKAWSIVQIPLVSAAFVSLDGETGAYHAMVGGFDYNLQQFNHVTQAWRQPGSGIKPFLYSSSLEKGYSPGTLILDAPLDMPGEDAGRTWSPQNDDGKYDGPITMRAALAHSKNVASVRLLRAVSVPYFHNYLTKFGFDPARQPKNLTAALGTGAVTPLQMAGAYAIFSNGGFQIKPYLIARIEDTHGVVIAEAPKPAALQETDRVLDQRNAFVTDSMLRDVTRYGTGAAATKQLGRSDIAGKTGTTSDAIDGWFSGYGANEVAVAWMGYDDPKSLGGREFGATLAMPIWIDYMRVALAKKPEQERPVPEGVVRANDDWIYTEYEGTTDFKSIDVDQAPPPPDTLDSPATPSVVPENL